MRNPGKTEKVQRSVQRKRAQGHTDQRVGKKHISDKQAQSSTMGHKISMSVRREEKLDTQPKFKAEGNNGVRVGRGEEVK